MDSTQSRRASTQVCCFPTSDFLHLYSALLECEGGGWLEFKGSPSSGVLGVGREQRGSREDLFDSLVEKLGLKRMMAATHHAE